MSHMHPIGEAACAGPLGKVNARMKLIVWLFLTVLVLLSRGAAFPVAVAIISLVAAISGGVALRNYLGRFGEPMFIALVLVLIKAFSISPSSGVEDAIASFGIFGLDLSVSRDGLVSGLLIACRMIGAVSLLLLLGFTTSFTSLLSALSWLKVPKTFIEILLLAHRYIFVLMDDAQVVYQSQKNRMGYAGVGRSLRSFGTLTGSVMLRAIDQSAATASAMTQRDYTGSFPAQRADAAFRPGETLFAVLVVFAAAACFAAMEGHLN